MTTAAPRRSLTYPRSQFEIEQLCLKALQTIVGLEHTEAVRIVGLKGARVAGSWDVLVIYPRLPANPLLQREAELALGALRQQYRLE
jgi:hypothetical protein